MGSPRKNFARFRNYERIVSSCMSVPACRMVIVEAWHDRKLDESFHKLNPVLALKATTVDVYGIRATDEDNSCRYSPSHSEMIEFGWHYESREERLHYLVSDEDYGLTEADFAFQCENVCWKAICCPWPPSKDEDRLAKVIAEVREEAREKVQRQEAVRRPAEARMTAMAGIEVGR